MALLFRVLSRLRARGLLLCSDRSGLAATEFAIIGPLLLIVLAGGADIGLATFNRVQINEAVSSATAAALLDGASLTSATVDQKAASLSTILAGAIGGSGATFQLSFNGARVYEFVGGGVSVSSGPSSAADECRCPVRSSDESGFVWGAKVNCANRCPNGSLAGKYVAITYKRGYTPLFPQINFIANDGLTVQTLALVQ